MKTLIKILPVLLLCSYAVQGQSISSQIANYNTGVNNNITTSNTHSQQITHTIVGDAFTNLSAIVANISDSLNYNYLPISDSSHYTTPTALSNALNNGTLNGVIYSDVDTITVFNQNFNTGSTPVDFTLNDGTATYAGGTLNFTGSPNDLDHYIAYNNGTMNEANIMSMTYIYNTVNPSTDYGLFIGFKSSNSFGAYDNIVGGLTTVSGANLGYATVGTQSTNPNDQFYGVVANKTAANGDTLTVTIQQSMLSYYVTVYDKTQGWTSYSSLNNTPVSPETHNTANPVIFHKGGSMSVINMTYKILKPHDISAVVVGNSLVTGVKALSVSNRASQQILGQNVLAGGTADGITDFQSTLQEVYTLAPSFIIAYDGLAKNDINAGTATAIWSAKLVAYRDSLVAHSRRVIWTTPVADNVNDVRPLRDTIYSEFGGKDSIIDLWAVTHDPATSDSMYAIYNGGDGIHPNTTCQQICAQRVNRDLQRWGLVTNNMISKKNTGPSDDTLQNELNVTNVNVSSLLTTSNTIFKQNTDSINNYNFNGLIPIIANRVVNTSTASDTGSWILGTGIVHYGGDTVLATYITNHDSLQTEYTFNASIYGRFNYHGGDPHYWQLPFLIFHSDTTRNISQVLGYQNGVTTLIFDNWSKSFSNNKGNIETYSLDHGITWSAATRMNNLGTLADSTSLPYGQIIKADSGLYEFAVDGNYNQLMKSTDMINWTAGGVITSALVIDYQEPGVTYIGHDSLIALVRKVGANSYAPEQFTSTNNGNTWTDAGYCSPMVFQTTNDAQVVSPLIIYDSTRRALISVSSMRNLNANAYNTEGEYIYANSLATVWASPSSWTYRGRFNRQIPNQYPPRGYPRIVQVNDSSFVGIVTDNYAFRSSSGLIEGIYSFSINYRKLLLGNQSKICDGCTPVWNGITNSFDFKNIQPAFVADTSTSDVFQTIATPNGLKVDPGGGGTGDNPYDIIYRDTTGRYKPLKIGTIGQLLTVSPNKPIWATPPYTTDATGKFMGLSNNGNIPVTYFDLFSSTSSMTPEIYMHSTATSDLLIDQEKLLSTSDRAYYREGETGGNYFTWGIINSSGSNMLWQVNANTFSGTTTPALGINLSGVVTMSHTPTFSLTSGNIVVGNSSNISTAIALSGDAAISNTGVLTIGANKITYSKIQAETNNTLLGNFSGSAASPAELTLGYGLTNSSSSILADTTKIITPTTLKDTANAIRSASASTYLPKADSNQDGGYASYDFFQFVADSSIHVIASGDIRSGTAPILITSITAPVTGLYECEGYYATTAGTSPITSGTLTWTDQNNNSQSQAFGGGTGIIQFGVGPGTIWAKAGTTISIQMVSVSGSGATYDFAATIKYVHTFP